MPGLSEHHHLPQRDLFERFATDPETGLAVDVAVDRLAALGPNSLTEAPGAGTSTA